VSGSGCTTSGTWVLIEEDTSGCDGMPIYCAAPIYSDTTCTYNFWNTEGNSCTPIDSICHFITSGEDGAIFWTFECQ